MITKLKSSFLLFKSFIINPFEFKARNNTVVGIIAEHADHIGNLELFLINKIGLPAKNILYAFPSDMEYIYNPNLSSNWSNREPNEGFWKNVVNGAQEADYGYKVPSLGCEPIAPARNLDLIINIKTWYDDDPFLKDKKRPKCLPSHIPYIEVNVDDDPNQHEVYYDFPCSVEERASKKRTSERILSLRPLMRYLMFYFRTELVPSNYAA